MKRIRLMWALAVVAVVTCGVAAVVVARPVARTVHLRGTAYEFNNVKVLLRGASIRVAEFPKLSAVVRADGSYDLAVPDHAKVTPYIVDPGYHTIYLQTFTTNGADLVNVNFQTPTDAAYHLLVGLLKVPVDAHGNPVSCAIVSTFNTRNVRDLSFKQFIAYGAHGVASATATASPSLPKAVYFNKDVVPDPSQTASSVDGGVVWTNVPAGGYTIAAHASFTRFASFVATCKPGRVVNANPPWGLHQLGLRNPTSTSSSATVGGGRTLVASLLLGHLPPASVVRVTCTGHGCPFAARTFRPRGSTLDVRRAAGGKVLALKAGDVLEVAASAHRFNGIVLRMAARATRGPKTTVLCVPLGDTAPQRSCPSG